MKISIFTFSKGDNYGAVLQSFALAQILREKGYQIEFIHLTWFNSWKQRLASLLLPQSYRFESFRKKYLRSFSKPCHKREDLSKAVKQTDLCIVGSDQVWNPDITGKYALHYFFDFLPDNMPRIAYAASFGNSKWMHPELVSSVNILLKKFSAISVREDSGIDICQKQFHVKATEVLDPTLLITDYSSYIKIPQVTPQIVSFKFHPSKEYYKLLEHISQDLCNKVCLMGILPKKDFKEALQFKIDTFTPVERWIGNIASATLVVTDSFHCTVFSILHRRQFIVITGNKKRKGRLYSLLQKLDLLDRLYEDIESVYHTDKWKEKICYDKVFDIIKEEQNKSLDFLTHNLKMATKKAMNTET